MTDKFLQEIREKISCPEFGDDHYGEWGILNINQRRTLKRLINYMDGQEAYIKELRAEIERLQNDLAISRKETKRYATRRASECEDCADDLEKALEKTESLKAEIRWAKETIDTLYKQIGNLKNLVTERDMKIEDLENRLKKFTTKNIVVARCGRGYFNGFYYRNIYRSNVRCVCKCIVYEWR